MGWITVLLYFVAAWQCLRIARGRRVRLVPREALPWWIAGIALLLLGVNKQLDLQSALTEIGRILARDQGWYEQRSELQRLFVIEVLVAGAVAVGVLAWLTRKAPLATRGAMVGLALLTAFVVIRASSFHHMDVLIDRAVLGIRMNWVFEIGGILLIVAAAWLRVTPAKQSARPKQSARA